jgi:uncharacterized repeat protein (TIGR03803 family)
MKTILLFIESKRYNTYSLTTNSYFFRLITLSLLLLILNDTAARAQDVLIGLTVEGGPLGGGNMFSVKTNGTNFTVHRNFSKAGVMPHGELLKGPDGNFYGMNSSGSSYNISTVGYGTIFKISPTGTLLGVKDLDYMATGAGPYGSFVLAKDGNFYAMTSLGGANGYGAIFRMTPAGPITVIKQLDNSTGGGPRGTLIQGTDGNLYGMTNYGGTSNGGTIFKITLTGTLTVLKNLTTTTGYAPMGNLLLSTDGNFYGVTSSGGTNGSGTVFKITPTGVLTVLKNFDYYVTGGEPRGSLVRATDGNFYGITYGGGSSGGGTIFKITPAGVFTVIKPLEYWATGSGSYSSLVQGKDGNFYGTTGTGGTYSNGTIFKCTPTGVLTVLRHLNYSSDGANPYGSLYENSDGYFYGMASSGGTNYTYTGTIFKISPTGVFTVLFRLPDGAFGFNPAESVVQAKDGFFYGMAHNGGMDNYGTIYKTSTNGTLTVLRHFDYYNTGGYPDGSLIQATDGNFYGMGTTGNNNLDGTIFKITPTGTFTVLKLLDETVTGKLPYGHLTQGNDGNFYGITNGGGTGGYGTIFKITPKGVFTVLKHLTSATGGWAYGSLTLGADGNFYGMTENGGANSSGSIFKITPTGVFTVLRYFDYMNSGASPWGSLVRAADGNFYGMCSYGGQNFSGTIFKITPSGTFTVLKHLNTSTTGGTPEGDLVQGSDGALYGMTSEGGNYGAGTLFRITTTGVFTVLRHFNYDTDGGVPDGTLIIQKPDPVVRTQTVSTPKNIVKKIKLTATGGGTPLIYAIATAPKNGTAVVIKDTLTYTPKTNFVGADSVYVTATWGCQKSVPAKIQVEVD